QLDHIVRDAGRAHRRQAGCGRRAGRIHAQAARPLSRTRRRMTQLTRPRAVIFDWDNTLIDSWAIIHDAMNVTLKAMDPSPWSYEETRARVRRALREAFPDLFGKKWERARDIFYTRFRTIHLDALTALPGAESLLTAMVEQGIWLGVVSNKNGDHLRL